MKSLIPIAAVAALMAGCATPSTAPNPNLDLSATSFTGWVRISAGEFQLFREQRDLDNPPSAASCVSGALPRDLQRTAADLNGSQVAFTGRAVAWADREQPQTMRFEGARIVNLCRGDHVIQARSVRVLR